MTGGGGGAGGADGEGVTERDDLRSGTELRGDDELESIGIRRGVFVDRGVVGASDVLRAGKLSKSEDSDFDRLDYKEFTGNQISKHGRT